jgi:hypothetical protein
LKSWISPAEIDALPFGRRSLTLSIPAKDPNAFGLTFTDFPLGGRRWNLRGSVTFV